MDNKTLNSSCIEFLQNMAQEVKKASADPESLLSAIQFITEKFTNGNEINKIELIKLIDQLEDLTDTELLLNK